MKNKSGKFTYDTARLIIYGGLTGVICGAVLSLFLACAKIVTSFSLDLYKHSQDAPIAVVCILILSILCCLLTAIVQKLCPSAKGSGIPLAEGSARGMLKVKWLSSAAALIVGSFMAFLSGLPLGSEGPSVGVGALIGEGVGKTAKKPVEFRRYLITGGASAGLAAAFNAPLTGIVFAFEEAHRRFSPYILLAVCSTVIPSVCVFQAVFFGLGQIPYLHYLGIHAGGATLAFLPQAEIAMEHLPLFLCVALISGMVCALFAALFNRAIPAFSKLLSRIKRTELRLLPVFLLSAAVGIAAYSAVGTGEFTLEHNAAGTGLLILSAILAARFVLTALASGSGATGGLFLPMIAIGGLIGVITSRLCGLCGMTDAYSANIIMLCVCAFFAASVRAPITAALLAVELTGSFSNLLPCIVAVATAIAASEFLKTEPLYERMLEDLQKAAPVPKGSLNMTVCGKVGGASVVLGKRIRDVLWPYNSLVIGLERNGTAHVPDGETTLREGDVLTVTAENVQPELFREQITDYIEIPDHLSSDGNT